MLFLSVAFMSLSVLTQPVAADEKDTEHIIFTEPIMVAGTMLKAGTYKLSWEGPGPEVQVTFSKNSKTLVTTAATLVLEAGQYDGAVKVRTVAGDSKILEAISWKKKSLVFQPQS